MATALWKYAGERPHWFVCVYAFSCIIWRANKTCALSHIHAHKHKHAHLSGTFGRLLLASRPRLHVAINKLGLWNFFQGSLLQRSSCTTTTIHTKTHMQTRGHTHNHPHMQTHATNQKHTYTNTWIHTHIHTHTHMYIRIFLKKPPPIVIINSLYTQKHIFIYFHKCT